MPNNEHTSKQFDAELNTVRELVLQMGGLAERQIETAIEALATGNTGLMNHVIAEDHRVNALEVEIDERCNTIIARRQPAANDLRLIIMIVKTITDLERIGDEAKKIAYLGKSVAHASRISMPRAQEFQHAAQLVTGMLRTSLKVFSSLDISSVAHVVRQDEQVDAEFHAIMRHLVGFMMEDPRTISTALEMLFIAKAIERIGDHAKNISEYVVYTIKGRDVRHATTDEIEREIGTSGP